MEAKNNLIIPSKRKEPESKKSDEDEEKPIYFFKDNYRFVQDHHQYLKVYTKRRWIGHTIFEILSQEFKLFTPEYFVFFR